MKINIVTKNVVLTNAMKEKINEKLAKIEKYDFVKPDTVCNVLVRTVKDDRIIEVTIPVNGKIIRAEKRDADIYAAIDMVEATLTRQVRKMKEKIIRGKRVSAASAKECVESEDPVFIRKERTIDLLELTPYEAVEEMELLDHDFHLFIENETKKPAAVYRRKDGGYGVIHTA